MEVKKICLNSRVLLRYVYAYGDKYGTGLCVVSFRTWRTYNTLMYSTQYKYMYLHVWYGVCNYEYGNVFLLLL